MGSFSKSQDKNRQLRVRGVLEQILDLSCRVLKPEQPLTPEELLLALTQHDAAHAFLKKAQVNMAEMVQDATLALMERHSIGGLQIQAEERSIQGLPHTQDFSHVLQHFAQLLREHPENADAFEENAFWRLLYALASLPSEQSAASQVLHDHGLSKQRLQSLVQSLDPAHVPRTGSSTSRETKSGNSTRDAIGNVALGYPVIFDPASTPRVWVERHDLAEQALRLMACQRTSGLLVVGEEGSGRSSLVRELAYRYNHAQAGPEMEHLRLVGLNLPLLLAQSYMRGDAERLLMRELMLIEEKSPQGIVLWLGDLGDWLETRKQGSDLLLLVRHFAERECIRFILSATPAQAQDLKGYNTSLQNQMMTLRLPAPTLEQAHKIVLAEAQHHAQAHKVTLAENLVIQTVERIHAKTSLDAVVRSSIEALDEACALARRQGTPVLTTVHVNQVLARQWGIPVAQVGRNWGDRLEEINLELRRRIVGQSPAIDALMQALQLAHAGLGRGGKTQPLGSFFFTGPTGVGKTELAQQLARLLDIPLLRLDMTEYQEAHNISRLIGSPPGYTGYKDTGQLAQALSQAPRTVVLLDEFEKAAPQVHALFLQILDRGFLTTGTGEMVDCRQALFVFTSNIGAQQAQRRSVGFLPQPDRFKECQEEAFQSGFPPEFRNRIEYVIPFWPLSPQSMQGVVSCALKVLAEDLEKQGHEIRFTPGVKKWLAQAGYSQEFGARPLQRLINREINVPLAQVLLRCEAPTLFTVGRQKDSIHIRTRLRANLKK